MRGSFIRWRAGISTQPYLGICCTSCSYHRYKEAINECTAALDAQPGYHKALTRRAKAYEQMGHYKQALSDVQKANKTADATPETLVCCCMQPPNSAAVW